MSSSSRLTMPTYFFTENSQSRDCPARLISAIRHSGLFEGETGRPECLPKSNPDLKPGAELASDPLRNHHPL